MTHGNILYDTPLDASIIIVNIFGVEINFEAIVDRRKEKKEKYALSLSLSSDRNYKIKPMHTYTDRL